MRRGLRLPAFEAADDATLRFNDALERLLLQAPPVGSVPIPDVRRLRAEGKGLFPLGGPAPEARWLEADAPGLPRLREIAPEHPKAIYLHLHGGGWTYGAPEQDDFRCARLSRAAQATVLSVEYRLAPEHPWPACGDDAAAGLRVAIARAEAEGGLPVFVGGESAGAHLAVVALLRLRAEGLLDRVAGAVLTYGCFDMRMTPSLRHWGPRNLVLSTPIVDFFIGNLLGADPAARAALAETPDVSPLLADLGAMPPALFQIGTEDPLLDDTLFMAERWRAAGDGAELVVWPGAVHGFDYFDRPEQNLPIALESQAVTARWIRERLAES